MNAASKTPHLKLFSSRQQIPIRAEVIGEINNDDKEVFEYKGKTAAVISNRPCNADLKEL